MFIICLLHQSMNLNMTLVLQWTNEMSSKLQEHDLNEHNIHWIEEIPSNYLLFSITN